MGQAIAEANAETMVIVMVESTRGLENLDEIASVPGLDVVHIGPQDLSISLGIPWQMDHPRLQEAITHVVTTCQRHGIVAGQNDRDAANFRQWYEMGFRFLCCNNDLNMLTNGAQQDARLLREIVAAGDSQGRDAATLPT
jgi:2-keto-3-deoxy-L-rhamnonate aldolase RhmA